MNRARYAAAVLASLYVLGGTVGHVNHGGPGVYDRDAGVHACAHEEWTILEAGCEGPCSNSRHHHHSPSHDPHVCPTCQFLWSPVLAVTTLSQERNTPLKIYRVSASKKIPQKLKLLVPPLRAPPPHPFS